MYSMRPRLAQERSVFGCVPNSFVVFEALSQRVTFMMTLQRVYYI
jgi:hypothetical protein